MRPKSKLIPLPEVLVYVKHTVGHGLIQLHSLHDAPHWLQLLARGSYIAHGNIVYVPDTHFGLVSSPYEADRDLATAKLLPYFMKIHDKQTTTKLKTTVVTISLAFQIFYFLYEYFYLEYCSHPKKDLIVGGFSISRRKWLFFKAPDEEILQKLRAYVST
jgi:hypothetical protein